MTRWKANYDTFKINLWVHLESTNLKTKKFENKRQKKRDENDEIREAEMKNEHR